MSRPNAEDAEEIDEIDAEDAELLLADPEDYHQAQRLKQIHDARQRVHDTVANFGEIASENVNERARMELANAVTMYIAELEPLIEDADAEVSLPSRYPWENARAFADKSGMLPNDHDLDIAFAPKPNAVQVFRLCNQFLADVKPLLTEDETTEWEV